MSWVVMSFSAASVGAGAVVGAAAPRRWRAAARAASASSSVGQVRVVDLRPRRRRTASTSVGLAQEPRVEPPGGDGVLDVVHRVGDVVGPVHDLGLEAASAGPGRPRGTTSKTVEVVVVDAELQRRRAAPSPRRHGYLVAASRLARVRLRPAGRPSGWARLGSSRVRMRSVWALPSKPPMPAATARRAPSRRCARTAGGRGRGPGRRCRRRRRCSPGPRRTRGRSGPPRGSG